MGRGQMIRLVNQFDPSTRHASVATATCSSCSCCCCCCCVVSGVTVATFAAVNLSRSSKSHEKGLGAWGIARPITVVVVMVIGLLVVGAALALSTISLSSSSGALVYVFFGFIIMGGILAAFYRSTGELHPALAGYITTGIGSVLATAEGLAILYSLSAFTNTAVFAGYVLLALAGIPVGVWVGRRVRWPQHQ